jgi:hypothetical protein
MRKLQTLLDATPWRGHYSTRPGYNQKRETNRRTDEGGWEYIYRGKSGPYQVLNTPSDNRFELPLSLLS